MQSGTDLTTVAFMHQFLSALLQQGSQLLQKTYEVSDIIPINCADDPRGCTTFKDRGKKDEKSSFCYNSSGNDDRLCRC